MSERERAEEARLAAVLLRQASGTTGGGAGAAVGARMASLRSQEALYEERRRAEEEERRAREEERARRAAAEREAAERELEARRRAAEVERQRREEEEQAARRQQEARRNALLHALTTRPGRSCTFEYADCFDLEASCYLAGTFTNWVEIPMARLPQSPVFRIVVNVPVGTHYYCFKIEDAQRRVSWRTDTRCPAGTEPASGRVCNKLIVDSVDPVPPPPPPPPREELLRLALAELGFQTGATLVPAAGPTHHHRQQQQQQAPPVYQFLPQERPLHEDFVRRVEIDDARSFRSFCSLLPLPPNPAKVSILLPIISRPKD